MFCGRQQNIHDEQKYKLEIPAVFFSMLTPSQKTATMEESEHPIIQNYISFWQMDFVLASTEIGVKAPNNLNGIRIGLVVVACISFPCLYLTSDK